LPPCRTNPPKLRARTAPASLAPVKLNRYAKKAMFGGVGGVADGAEIACVQYLYK
jgi:hypothetical protein